MTSLQSVTQKANRRHCGACKGISAERGQGARREPAAYLQKSPCYAALSNGASIWRCRTIRTIEFPPRSRAPRFVSRCRLWRLLDVSHASVLRRRSFWTAPEATALYDFFEDVIEAALDSMRSVNVRISRIGGRRRIAVTLECEAELSALARDYPGAELDNDEGEWTCLLTLGTGVRADDGIFRHIAFLSKSSAITALCNALLAELYLLIEKISHRAPWRFALCRALCLR